MLILLACKNWFPVVNRELFNCWEIALSNIGLINYWGNATVYSELFNNPGNEIFVFANTELFNNTGIEILVFAKSELFNYPGIEILVFANCELFNYPGVEILVFA